MASSIGVARTLAFLNALYPQYEVTAATAGAWLVVFAGVDDDALASAAKACSVQAGRKFCPTVGELREMLDRATPKIDATTVLRKIEALGSYNPNVGWIWPRIDTVRQRFGDALATAYGSVGPSRFASGNETTREIALRDFAEDVKALPAADLVPRLAPPTDTLLLPPLRAM